MCVQTTAQTAWGLGRSYPLPRATGHVRWDSELATGLSSGQCAGLPDDFPYTPCSIHSGLRARSFNRHSDHVPLLLSLRWLPLPREQSPSSSRRPEATGSGLVNLFKALPCSPPITGCPLCLPPCQAPLPWDPRACPGCFSAQHLPPPPPQSAVMWHPQAACHAAIHTLHTVV